MQSLDNLQNGEVANNTFGGGASETVLGVGVAVLAVLAIVLVLVVRRKLVLGPLMFAIVLLPFGQTLVLGGFHLFAYRILVLVGLLRAVTSRTSRGSLFGTGRNSLDTFFILWAIFRAMAFVLRFREMGAILNQAGFLWDAIGGYLLMRFLIQDDEDCLRLTKILSAIAAVLAVTMLYEKLYDVNLYGFLTAAPIIPEIRNGSIRAQGPFHHAILAGTFGATLLPLFIWLWMSKKARLLGLLGMLASTVITVTAASSTPVSAYLAAIISICCWPLRRSMRLIRWGFVIGVVMLNFAMHAPVWWALEHVDLAGGSAGEHRAELIDNFIRHFGDWWLIGTSDNASWGFEMWDISNQYVSEGEVGGLATFICFASMLYLGYKWIGISRGRSAPDRTREWQFWLLGATLFSNCVAFMGISYFDQTRFYWYALLALISVTTGPLVRRTANVDNKQQSQAEQPAASVTSLTDDPDRFSGGGLPFSFARSHTYDAQPGSTGPAMT